MAGVAKRRVSTDIELEPVRKRGRRAAGADCPEASGLPELIAAGLVKRRAAKASAHAEGRQAKRARSAPIAGDAEIDPNEEIVLRPYMRGTLALLSMLPADRPIEEAELQRAAGRPSPSWSKFVTQLIDMRLVETIGIDQRQMFLITPAGLVLRRQICLKPRPRPDEGPTLLDLVGLERLAILEAVAAFGPLQLPELVDARSHLPGSNREAPLARSRFIELARNARMLEVIPGDESLPPAARHYRATDMAWRLIAARRRLHPFAYDLSTFGRLIALLRSSEPAPGKPKPRLALPRRRHQPAAPGQLSLL
jgi:hypothetical protein